MIKPETSDCSILLRVLAMNNAPPPEALTADDEAVWFHRWNEAVAPPDAQDGTDPARVAGWAFRPYIEQHRLQLMDSQPSEVELHFGLNFAGRNRPLMSSSAAWR